MGFNSIICVDQNNCNVADFCVTKEIAEKFKECQNYGIIGFLISEKNFISFKGNLYNNVIKNMTKNKYNMYSDINKEQIKEIHDSIHNFINNYDCEELHKIQNIYNSNNIESFDVWCLDLIDDFIPSPKEIVGLTKIFKLCYENNLKIHASS